MTPSGYAAMAVTAEMWDSWMKGRDPLWTCMCPSSSPAYTTVASGEMA
eukprot:CAMPEP_0175972116 /NCGR_PEP_ID=MMETSP0108-20121206/42041_1 /TAXON_ID=195067 ORGANISM="Goniomonas pacifica, Strain CCMP1869" /NCGR_SAMPLE_ID=MMETSP0108 /ASSEMBLY_ACC=CAM_ASM_000204 /LENGTH=47 /DNA_ID= /DNA_START= /DNA_END= /DNA_ORIENTATION=